MTYAHRSHHYSRGCGGKPVDLPVDLGALLAMVTGWAGKRGRHGGPPWADFGPGWGGPPWGGGGRGRTRRSRGDVRAAVLLLLDEEPRNGYQLMQEVEDRSAGAWRPSPGSIYPALAQLEDEGLATPSEGAQGKVYSLTEAGREYVAKNRESLGVPWETANPAMPDGLRGLRDVGMQVGLASMQVAQTGDERLIGQAQAILAETRRNLYRLLAEDGGDESVVPD